MIFTLISLIIFSGVLFIFGWQSTRFALKEKRIEVLIPIAVVAGVSFYLFSLNLLSYFTDIKINFYLLLAFFGVLSCLFFRLNKNKGKPEWGIDKKWRKILFATCFLIVFFTGFIGIRSIKTDELFFTHLPLASTIADGNFPPKVVFAPGYYEQYHYGYSLFFAAVSEITNLPIWFAGDFHNTIFIGLVFLLGFLLIRDFCKDNFKAYAAALVMLLGGNLNFIYGIEGISALYRKYILQAPVEAPFKFLSDMIFGKAVSGGLVIPNSQISWMALGWALTIAIIYLYFKAAENADNWFKISFLAGIIFSFLALSSEIFFGALGIVLFLHPIILAIFRKERDPRIYFKTSFIILLLGIFFAFIQGGIVTQTIQQNLLGGQFAQNHYLSISFTQFLKGLMPFGFLNFLLRWGWLMIFIVPAVFYFLKKQFQLGLFLILLIAVSFFLPLTVAAVYEETRGAFARVNFLSALFGNLIFGFFLGGLAILCKNSRQKLFISILILAVISQALLYFFTHSIFPGLETDRPFLGEPAKPNQAESEAFSWIRANTTINDYFLTFWDKPAPSRHDYDSKFIIYTGRFAPSFLYTVDIQPDAPDPIWRNFAKAFIRERTQYYDIAQECDSGAVKNLNYHYLYVNKNWPEGLEKKCLANNNLKLVFRSDDNKIYKILTNEGLSE